MYIMKLDRGLPVCQKPKDIFSQIISPLWKGHNNRSDFKTIYKNITETNRRVPYWKQPEEIRNLKLGIVHCKNPGVKFTPDWIQYRSNLEWCQFNTIAVLF